MNYIIEVLNLCYKLFQYRLSFPPFSFTIWQALLGMSILAIFFAVIIKLIRD